MIQVGIGIGVFFTIFATLIGIIYKRLRQRVNDNEKKLTEIEESMNTITTYLFGIDKSDGDKGKIGDVEEMEEKIDHLDKRLDKIEKQQKKNHDEIRDALIHIIEAVDNNTHKEPSEVRESLEKIGGD